MNRKSYTLIGAAVGLAVFLALALLPSLLYGGYAGVLLAGGIFGTPVKATFLVRALIVFGMVMGVTSVASLFAIGGAASRTTRSRSGRWRTDRASGCRCTRGPGRHASGRGR